MSLTPHDETLLDVALHQWKSQRKLYPFDCHAGCVEHLACRMLRFIEDQLAHETNKIYATGAINIVGETSTELMFKISDCIGCDMHSVCAEKGCLRALRERTQLLPMCKCPDKGCLLHHTFRNPSMPE